VLLNLFVLYLSLKVVVPQGPVLGLPSNLFWVLDLSGNSMKAIDLLFAQKMNKIAYIISRGSRIPLHEHTFKDILLPHSGLLLLAPSFAIYSPMTFKSIL
jgi:hypothetical protein